jgi:hypothetical protein
LKHEEEGVMAGMRGKKGKKGKKGKAILKKPPHQPSDFKDFSPTNPPDPNAQDIRAALTTLRKSLFVGLGVTPSDFKTIIRIQSTKGSGTVVSASCGCGCS